MVNFVVQRDDKVLTIPIKVEKRSVVIKEQESQIAEVDGALPGEESRHPVGETVP